jgi:hypothetical protein
MPTVAVKPARSRRIAAGVAAAVIGLAVASVVGFVVSYSALIIPKGVVVLLSGVASLAAGGMTAAWIYTRSVDGPIRWRSSGTRRHRSVNA